MKKTIYVLAISLATSGLSQAVLNSFTFSNPFSGNVAVAGNLSGIATNGLYWGIIVDTDDDGFSSSYESGFSFTDDLVGSNFTNSDDTLYITTTQTLFVPIGSTYNGVMDATAGFEVGDTVGHDYALFWFDDTVTTTVGNVGTVNYGFFTDASMVIGGAGAGNSADSLFDGSILTASNTFTAVPEPSSVVLLGLGSVALLLRRRR